jgi:hypothetical protein
MDSRRKTLTEVLIMVRQQQSLWRDTANAFQPHTIEAEKLWEGHILAAQWIAREIEDMIKAPF